MLKPEEILEQLFCSLFNEVIENITPLAQSGSYRQYYRIKNKNHTILGVYNTDLQENKAYLSFTNTFYNADVKVPKIHIVSEDKKAYLIEDLGPESLWDCAQKKRLNTGQLHEEGLNMYKKSLDELIKIQTQTIENLDLSFCYPRDTFDKQSMLWDLNYYKYFFLRLLRVNIDEQKFENDIQALSSELDNVNQDYFLYRDFQSRNVMIKENSPYFIDFQGGRKGAFYYDVASLLYDANIELIKTDRDLLLTHYYEKINAIIPTEKKTFLTTFSSFAIIRLAQALGAFGLRGVIEKKPNFKECIPYALKALRGIVTDSKFSEQYPTLSQSFIDAEESLYIKNVISQ